MIINIEDYPQMPIGRAKDYSGQKYQHLTYLYRTTNDNNGRPRWICQCDCGNYTIVQSSNIGRGTVSCGCRKKNIAKELHFQDLTGQRFGKLIVISLKDKRTSDGKNLWHCKCDCGSYIDVRGQYLKSGHTQSCGCIQSIGEEKISQLLINNNIYFIKQKTFSTCRGNKTHPLKFDFYINESYLIEYDGISHFTITGGWNTEEHLKTQQERDNIKNQWCKENNIPLIRIPYTHLNNLCLEDLLLETSEYIVND